MEKFTTAEKNLLCIFKNQSRRRAASDLQSILPHLDEKDMLELAQSVIGKLERMTDKEFEEEVLEGSTGTGQGNRIKISI